MGVLHRGFGLLGFVLTALLSASAVAEVTSLEDLAFYSEVYPPANFIKDDAPAGYSVDILIEAAKLQGVQITPQKIVIQPWARSYRATLTNNDAVLFSTTRTEHREDLFKWVGPISDIKAVVLARVDSGIVIKEPIDMAKYRIGR
ncbi:hypothetical protein BOO35_15645 [Vibrio navarrensis]|uniref:substrate-binding periplasmic protein n=1 Tax=Vibrio navarrensis TaxID=29495 RepID=UPI001867B3EE|nr:ABC transporter substrate-binding protein [Vibrio navarrensis]MBE3666509.1 hypothetical protein [Vibrio navarrensis]